jgi:probable selenium-dependent hydroxylase accessory protein YqeC
MRLKEALDIKPGEVISLVGGGGKTTLMFALARELASDNSCVLTTTTTKIFEPLPSQTPFLLLEADEEKMVKTLVQNMDRYRHITLARERLPSGKLEGISPDLVVRLARLERVSCIIVEADGANQRSLKAPNPTEPVIPNNTSLLIPVVGVDAVGCRLTEENVFRSEIVCELIGLPRSEVISAESIAFLITHHQGIIKGSPEGARIIPFANKVDLDKGLSLGRDLANKILAVKHPRIERVILGQVQSPEPVVEVIQGGFHG